MSDKLEGTDPRLSKRVDDHICAACRKPILPGHRINAAFIVMNPRTTDPKHIGRTVIELNREHEYAHIRCKDPFLNGRRFQ